MKRLSLLFGSCMMSQIGSMIFSRNKTELKDTCIRFPVTDVIFFGGDILMASLLANAVDKLFKTKLAKPAENKFQKIFMKKRFS